MSVALVAAIASAIFCAPAFAQTANKSAENSAPSKVTFTWREHPSVRLGQFARLDLRIRAQGDARASQIALDPETRSVDWARRRVGITGAAFGRIEFEIERELGDHADPWRDVFLNYEQFDALQIQAGKFKLPFGMEENTSAFSTDFIARARVSDRLTPGRDRGVMLHGHVIHHVLAYELGGFDHDGANARRSNLKRTAGGRTVAGRVTIQPLRPLHTPASTLEFSAAATATTVEEGWSSLKGDTVLGSTFYNADIWVSGPQRRRGFELRWRPGPASIKAEYVRLTAARQGQSVEDSDLPPLVARGWYISGTWILTGESKVDGLSTPRRPFLRGGVGAVELAVRVESLLFSSEADDETPSMSPRARVVLGNEVRAITYGLNWQPARWFKLQLNLVHESLADPAQGPQPATPAFWSRVLRLQFAL